MFIFVERIQPYTMKKNLILLSLFLVTCLQACVTVKIDSNKEASYTKKPKKIYILISGAKQAKIFCQAFSDGLQSKFNEKGIQSESYVYNPLSLETDSDIDKRINQYSPEALLVIKQKQVHSTNGGVDGGTFELSLIDGATKKPVWKSELDVYGQMGMDDALEKSIATVCKKMEQDQLL